MTQSEINFALSFVPHPSIIVEYGCGASTVYLRDMGYMVKSIETDRKFADQYYAKWVDLGRVRKWGYPIKPPTPEQLEAYRSHAKDFDLLIIDGRYRVDVAVSAQPGIIAIHDYHRPQYHAVEQFMQKIATFEHMAVFEKTEPAPKEMLTNDPL
jgi:hypothetical protein